MVWVHISEYPGGIRKLEAKRERDILMKKNEIFRYEMKVKEMWATLIPMEIYAKGNLIKVRVALVRGRKKWEKKNVLKERDLDRETAKTFKF
jgi:SsrA-binding protein